MTEYLRREAFDFEAPGAPSLLDELSFWSSRFGHLFFQNFPFSSDLRILDLGCGNGFPLFELAHELGPTCRVIGLDTWSGALKRAGFKRELYGTGNADLVRGDGSRLPFGDGRFHRVISNLGINNFDNPPAVLAECHRILDAHGSVTLTTNVCGHMREFYDVFHRVLGEVGDPDSPEKLAAHENHRSSRMEIEAKLSAAGFQTVKAVEDQFTMRYADGSALLRHPLVRVGFLDGWRSVVSPENEERVFTLLEDRLNQIARQAGGELRMTVPMLYIEGHK
jgi:ubiquinone/menaquinone biosynthesis C-methylase UbiE